MRSGKLWAVVSIVCLAVGASAQSSTGQPISKYLKSLQTENAAMKKLNAEVRLFVNSGTRDKARTDIVGQHILERIESLRVVIIEYKEATTRFGLQVEFDTLRDTLNELAKAWKAYGVLTGVEPEKLTEIEMKEAREETKNSLEGMLAKVIDQQLGSHGLAEALTKGGFSEVKSAAVDEVKNQVLREFDLEMLSWAKFGVPLGSFKDQVRKTGRRLAVKYVGSLVVKFTSNSLIIELVSRTVVRWAGDKLKRALRNKGDLDSRTEVTLGVLEESRRQLNELLGTDSMDTVRLAVENGERAIKSMKFLHPDLDRSGRNDLHTKINDAEFALNRTLYLVRLRFMIGNELAQKDFAGILDNLDELSASVNTMMGAPPVEIDVSDDVAGFYLTKYSIETEGFFQEVRIEGTMDKLEFDYKAISTNGDVTSHWKGTLTWQGSDRDYNADKTRTLKGRVSDQRANRTLGSSMRIEKSDDGKWRATVIFNISGGTYDLVKQSGGFVLLAS